MRAFLLLTVATAAGWTACGGEAHAHAVGDGTLVLEVGGEHASLREALVAAGVTVAPPQRIVTRVETPAVGPTPAGVGADPAADATAPAHGPRVSASPPERTVELREGETLIHVARRTLGDGRRYQEIMALNGWSEADTRRLRPGQKIKIPADGGSGRR
jgi:nucleoid-associated protein YgaU